MKLLVISNSVIKNCNHMFNDYEDDMRLILLELCTFVLTLEHE